MRWVRTLLTVAAFAGAASAQVTHFGLTAPANPQAGVPFTLGITALDKNTQAVTNYTGTISLDIGGVFTASPLFTFTPGDQGALNVPVTLRIVGKVSMVVTDTVSGVGGNITVDVLPTHLSVSAPASATAGVPFSVSVVALDQNDNPLPAFSDLIGFVTQDPGATVPAPLLMTGNGTYSITAGTAGNRRLDVTDIASGFTIFGSAQYTVSSAGASHFRVTTPATVLAGAMFSFQVAAVDPFNNLDPSFSDTVHFSSTDGAAILPPDTALVNGQGSFLATLNTAGNEALLAASGTVSGSARLAVPGPATHLRLAAPAHTYPGSAFHLAVEASDAAGTLVTNYSGTIHFSSSDAAAVLPADFVFAPSDKGMHSFGNGVILKTGGIQSLTVTQIASAISGGASVRVGPKAGCFQPGVSLSEGRHPSAVAAADFDLDSKQDIAIADQGTDLVSATVTYLGGKGDGSFRLPQTFAAPPDLFDIVAADLNGDGKPDLVTGGFGLPYLPKTLTVLLGNGDGTFQPHVDYRVASAPAHLAVADLNHDGFPDIAAADFGGDVVDILLNHGDGTFEPGLIAQGSNTTFNNLYGVAVGDLDGDGIPDLVAANLLGGATGDISIMLGSGDGTFQPATHLADGGMGPYSLAMADLNGDGKQDLVAVNIKDDSLSVLLGNGDGTFQPAVLYFDNCCGAFGVSIADMNNDGQLDLIVANNSGGTASVRYGNGDGTFQPATPLPLFATGVSVADFDGDGLLDIVGVYGSGSITTLTNGNCGGPATHLMMATPSIVGASEPFNFVVSALDQFGLIDGGYRGTVNLTSSDNAASLPANYTFVPGDRGAHSFAATLFTIGIQTIAATDTGDPSISANSGPIKVATSSTTSLASSASPARFHQLVVLTATVGSVGGTPTGTVTFKDGAVALGSAPLSAGIATLPVVLGPVGRNILTAAYSGDADFAPSSASLVVYRSPQPH